MHLKKDFKFKNAQSMIWYTTSKFWRVKQKTGMLPLYFEKKNMGT